MLPPCSLSMRNQAEKLKAELKFPTSPAFVSVYKMKNNGHYIPRIAHLYSLKDHMSQISPNHISNIYILHDHIGGKGVSQKLIFVSMGEGGL